MKRFIDYFISFLSQTSTEKIVRKTFLGIFFGRQYHSNHTTTLLDAVLVLHSTGTGASYWYFCEILGNLKINIHPPTKFLEIYSQSIFFQNKRLKRNWQVPIYKLYFFVHIADFQQQGKEEIKKASNHFGGLAFKVLKMRTFAFSPPT